MTSKFFIAVAFFYTASCSVADNVSKMECDLIVNGNSEIDYNQLTLMNSIDSSISLQKKVKLCGNSVFYRGRLEKFYLYNTAVDNKENIYLIYSLGQTTDVSKVIVYRKDGKLVSSGFLVY